MALGLIGTIAADGKILLAGKRSQQGDQSLRRGLAHFAAVATREGLPTLGSKRLRKHPGNECGAWRQLRNPHVEIVQAGDILLPHSTGRTAHGSEADALSLPAGGAEADDVDGQNLPGESGSALAEQGGESPGCHQPVCVAQELA